MITEKIALRTIVYGVRRRLEILLKNEAHGMASLDIRSERGRTFNRDGSVDEDLPNRVIPDF